VLTIISKLKNAEAISINCLKKNMRVKNAIFLNPHSLRMAFENEEFYKSIEECEYLFCDGIGLKVISRLYGINVIRNTGLSQTIAILSNIENEISKIALVGTTPEILSALSKKLTYLNPSINIKNCISPDFKTYFGAEDAKKIAEELNKTRPNIILIGMTAPKQEILSMYLKEHLNFPVIILCVGAVFDYLADEKNMPPKFIRKCGLEWLYRLYNNPIRMWRRTFVSIPLLCYYLITKRTL
jgi:N-acetylglucosaminyldiphosphoundecaprenol N-acetyl-beta-D-mannosaminyltransferase